MRTKSAAPCPEQASTSQAESKPRDTKVLGDHESLTLWIKQLNKEFVHSSTVWGRHHCVFGGLSIFFSWALHGELWRSAMACLIQQSYWDLRNLTLSALKCLPSSLFPEFCYLNHPLLAAESIWDPAIMKLFNIFSCLILDQHIIWSNHPSHFPVIGLSGTEGLRKPHMFHFQAVCSTGLWKVKIRNKKIALFPQE